MARFAALELTDEAGRRACTFTRVNAPRRVYRSDAFTTHTAGMGQLACTIVVSGELDQRFGAPSRVWR